MHMREASASSAEPDGGGSAAPLASSLFRETVRPTTHPQPVHEAGSKACAGLNHPRATKYRPDIDGLRAVAVLSVLAFHAFPGLVHGGYVGVDLFFVISGFLISTIVFESLEHGTFSYVDFYARRIRRIFPALGLVLSSCLVFGWFALTREEFQQLGKHIFSGASFVSNIALWRESGYFDNSAETKPLLHLWSLGIEEQFYIFWPLLLSFAWKRKLGFLTLTGLIAVASFAINMLTVKVDPTAAFYSPFSRFWELMAGGVLAYLLLHKPQYFPQKNNAFSVAGLLLIASAILFFDKNDVFPGWRALLPTAGAFLVIAAGPQAWLNRNVLGNRAPVLIGLISYPLYLWHWPLLSFANIILVGLVPGPTRIVLLLASVALATLTYRYVELPFRSRKNIAVKMGGVCALLAVLAASGVLVFRDGGFPSRAVAQGAGVVQQELDASIRQRYAPEPCGLTDRSVNELCSAYNTHSTGPLMVVWGDSHAKAWLPVFFKIAHDRNLRVMLISHLGCPPLLRTRRTDGAESAALCSEFGLGERIVDSIHDLNPSIVFLVARWSLYGNGWVRYEELQKATHFLTTDAHADATRETSRAAMLSQFPATVDALLKIASKVVIFQNPPLLRGALLPRSFDHPAKVEQPAADDRESEAFNRAVVSSMAKPGRVAVFNPVPRLCESRCAAVLNGVPVYYDDNHVSAQGSILFENDIIETMAVPD